MSNKKKILYSIIAFILILIGISFAYMAVNILGLSKTTSGVSKNIEITFTESGGTSNGEINVTNINPSNDSFASKTMLIENTGDETIDFDLIWSHIKNTFMEIEDLKLYLTCTNGCDDNVTHTIQIPKSGSNRFIKDYTINYGAVLEGFISLKDGVYEESDLYYEKFNMSDYTNYNQITSVYLSDLIKTNINVDKVTSTSTYFNTYKTNNSLNNESEKNVKSHMIENSIYEFETNLRYRVKGKNNIYTYVQRGENSKNNIFFAGAYWKVIRVNEDGSVRLILAPPTVEETSKDGYKQEMYNITNNITSFGSNETFNNSSIKNILESWYETYLSEYDTYLKKDFYCNDTTLYNLPTVETDEFAILYYLDLKNVLSGIDLYYYTIKDKNDVLNELETNGYYLKKYNYSIKETIKQYLSDLNGTTVSDVETAMQTARTNYLSELNNLNSAYNNYVNIKKGNMTFDCQISDSYYTKIGLITAYEAALAGNSVIEHNNVDYNTIKTNSNQYLSFFKNNILTMTPALDGYMFSSNGLWLTTTPTSTGGYIYPVINLTDVTVMGTDEIE